jgi:hypothetical protein
MYRVSVRIEAEVAQFFRKFSTFPLGGNLEAYGRR